MRSSIVLALTASLALGTVMCSSSGDSGGDTPPSDVGGLADGRFSGVMTGQGDLSGVLDITVEAPATGTRSVRPLADAPATYTLRGSVTLNVPSLGPVALEGTLDLATNTATFKGTFAGGAVTFTGTYANGVIRGEAVSARGKAPFVLTNRELGAIRTYCGSFSGGLRGRWSILTVGSQAGVVFAASDGRVGDGEGTLSNGALAVTLRPEGSATGGESAGQISGSWTIGAATGAFATSESACAALTPSESDAGTDGGPIEAGPPGTPETVVKVPGTVFVSHLALAGSRLFYAVDHPYFMQKVQIGAVGTDGSAPADVVPLTTGMDAVAGLTATNAKVYWVNGGSANDSTLFSVASAGGAITTHEVVGGVSNADFTAGVSRVVNDGTSVFVSFYSSSTSAIRSFGLDGTPIATLANQVGVMGLGLEGNDILFGEFKGVQRIPKTLTGNAAIVSAAAELGDTNLVVNLVSDADNVYFLANASFSTTLWRKPKAGGALAPVIATAPGRARGLALVGDSLYFVYGTSTGGQTGQVTANLMRIAKTATNGVPTTIGPANVNDVLTDGTYVYYGEGTMVRRVRH